MLRKVHSDEYMGRSFDMRSYNCWHLVRDVWRDMTGVDLGDLTPPQTDRGSLDAAAWEAADGAGFDRLERAQQPCIVLLRRPRDTPHVGVLLRGRLLHMTPSGVHYQPLEDVAREFASVAFYLPRAAAQGAA